jgi:hypothetical protein
VAASAVCYVQGERNKRAGEQKGSFCLIRLFLGDIFASQEWLFPKWIMMRGPKQNSSIDESGCMLNVHKELMKHGSEGRNGGKIIPVHILKTGEKGGVVHLVPSLGARWK